MIPWLRPYRTALAAGTLAVLLTNVFHALGPWLLKGGIDSLGAPGTRTAGGTGPDWPVAGWAAAVVVVAALDGIFRYIMRKTVIGVSRRVEYDLRAALHSRIQRLPMSFFERREVGDLMARSTNDLNAVRMFLGPGIMYFVNTLLVLAFSVTLMLRLSPSLTGVALLPMPFVTVAVVLVLRHVHDRSLRVQEGYAELTTRVRESLEAVRVVQAFAKEESQSEIFDATSRDYYDRNIALARVQRLFLPSMTLFSGAALALVLWRGGLRVSDGTLTLGSFVAFTGYLMLLMWPMAALGWTLSLFQRGKASWRRLSELLEETEETLGSEGVVPPADAPEGRGRVTFEGVHLELGGRAVLDGIDLDVEPGSITAIVGPTGSGKSSLLRLLARLREPSAGTVRLDGVALPEWNLPELRRALAFVPQEAFLFSDSIARNLEVGSPGASREEIELVADLAALSTEIETFTEGYDAVVGERGVTLSGGQRQRATLARALVRPARVLVLDDAFSAMDAGTEESILERVRAHTGGATVLLVSHRLSTVRRADRVVVLDEGRIVEDGAPDALLAKGGRYAQFVRRQLLLEELEGRSPGAGEAA